MQFTQNGQIKQFIFFLSFTLLTTAGLGGMTGCMSAYKKSVGAKEEKKFSRTYRTNFNRAWKAVLEALQSHQIDISNRESGYVQTKWKKNTAQKNFVDSFGPGKAYLKAQYRFRIDISKGFYEGDRAVKVDVQKEQLVKRDVLEGWEPVLTEGIEEKTLLYRIGRIIFVRTRIREIRERKAERELEEGGF